MEGGLARHSPWLSPLHSSPRRRESSIRYRGEGSGLDSTADSDLGGSPRFGRRLGWKGVRGLGGAENSDLVAPPRARIHMGAELRLSRRALETWSSLWFVEDQGEKEMIQFELERRIA